MNKDQQNTYDNTGDERRSIRALRLNPLRESEKETHAAVDKRVQMQSRQIVQPSMRYSDPNGDRPLNIERPPRRRWSWIHTAFAGGVVVLLGILMYPVLFPKATVTVTPRTATLTFDDSTFTASKDGEEGVRYALVPVVISETASVAATQKKKVEEKARGIITVENRALATTQRLIKNTRFESSTGKIYRIRESIEVPGYVEKGGVKQAGTLDVEVFADETGDGYNLKEGSLTIPGLKDKDDLYTGITAKVKTAITGGSTGTKFVISDSERTAATKGMESSLLTKARTKAQEALTDKTMTLRGAEVYTYRDLPDEANGTNVIVGSEITYYQMIFDKNEIAEYLRAESSVPDLPDSPAVITNIDKLGVTLPQKTKQSSLGTQSVFSDKSLTFTLSGSPVLEWSIDTDAVKRDLAGASRDDINTILKKNPTIGAGTQVDIMPFWNNSVPSEGAITVVVNSAK